MKYLAILVLGVGMCAAKNKQAFTDFPCNYAEGNSLDNDGHVGTLTLDAKSVCGLTGKWNIYDLVVDGKHYSRCDAVKDGKRRCYLRQFENVGDGAQSGMVSWEDYDACTEANCKRLWDDGAVGVMVAPKPPEPMDVPALVPTIPRPQATWSAPCSSPPDRDLSHWVCIDGKSYDIRTTCADKHRVLLTSEDGAKHCILFPKEKP